MRMNLKMLLLIKSPLLLRKSVVNQLLLTFVTELVNMCQIKLDKSNLLSYLWLNIIWLIIVELTLNHPFYLNEDLPFSLRRDQSILRQKKKEAIGITADLVKINYKNKTIKIANETFSVKNGCISGQSSQSSTGSAFLGQPASQNQNQT